jgi:hypothetical protein
LKLWLVYDGLGTPNQLFAPFATADTAESFFSQLLSTTK